MMCHYSVLLQLFSFINHFVLSSVVSDSQLGFSGIIFSGTLIMYEEKKKNKFYNVGKPCMYMS